VTRVRLRRDVLLVADYDDRTAFGSPIRSRADRAVRALYAPVADHLQQYGHSDLVAASPRLLRQVVESDAFRQIAEPDAAGAWRLREEVLYPQVVQAPPRWLGLQQEDSGRALRWDLPLDCWPRVHGVVAALAGAGCDTAGPAWTPDQRAMLADLREHGMLEAAAAQSTADPTLATADLTFLGHNAVVVRSGATRLLLDPLLLPGGSEFPAAYQPLQIRDVGPLDAVLITHSHRDHFDVGSLVQLPADAQLVVPRIERETLLAAHMAARLREVGFTHVTELRWWQSLRIGEIEVHALPFYGEQPTDGEVLHPEVRNAGNLYLVRTPRFAAAFLVDAGRDGQGNVKQVAAEARERFGPIDVVFSGYRGWLTYPVQHIFSSVARHVLFVPPALWTVRQQIMSTADDALDVAERWGARYLVPYADGGAPWYWRIGLGPRLDEAPSEVAAFDPFPERVVAAARNRTQTPDGRIFGSPVQVLLLRPGDSLVDVSGEPRLVRLPGHAWPYAHGRIG
jgi:L-ascorbate metabolism protein UlaG (beta-lactamase superfamily)